MPTYQARNLGGIGGSGVYPPRESGIDLPGTINALANAFRLTKDGILTRAVMQQNAQRQREAAELDRQRFDFQRQQFDAQQREAQNREQAQYAKYLESGYEDITDRQPEPGATDQLKPHVTIGQRKLYLNPENTPRAKKRRALLQAGAEESKVDAMLEIPGLADDFLFPKQQHTPRSEAMHADIEELVNSGVPLEEASQRVRMMYGGTPPRPSNGRGGSTAEDPEHRETRQNFYTNARQLQDARGDLNTLDKKLVKPLPLTATPADSAARRELEGQRPALTRRVDELRQMGDSLGAATRGDYSVPGHAPAAVDPKAAGTQAYAQAAEAYKAALAQARTPEDREHARRRYDRLVMAIAKRFNQREN